MHVLYVIDSLVPGGAERSLAALAGEYRKRGVQLDVAYLHDRPGLHEELESAGARMIHLRAQNLMTWIRGAHRLASGLHPDLIHSTLFQSDMVGRIAGLTAGVPVASSLVNPEYGRDQLQDRNLNRWKVRAAQMLDILTARNVKRFHCTSTYVADVMARRLLIPRSRIDVIPRGRALSQLGQRTPERAAHARESVGLNPSRPIVLAVARQEFQKGLDLLLLAMPSVLRVIPDACLLVAGRPGRLSSQLHSMMLQLELEQSVRFLGSRSDVPELLCAADVFVCPSRWEGFGGAVIEAMALGAPIVAFGIPPLREVLDADTALIAEPGRPDALADRIVHTLADAGATALRTKRAQQSFQKNFTVSAVAMRMIDFYERCIQ